MMKKKVNCHRNLNIHFLGVMILLALIQTVAAAELYLAQQPDASLVLRLCNTLEADRPYSNISMTLRGQTLNVLMFGNCKNQSIVDNLATTPNPKLTVLPPLHVAFLKLESRSEQITGFLEDLEDAQDDGMDIDPILDRLDVKGRSLLGFILYQRTHKYKEISALDGTFNRLIQKVCRLASDTTRLRSECVELGQ